jgi:hypothetical protein
MSVSIRHTSRLSFARLITLDGVEHWESPEFPEIGTDPTDLLYTAGRDERIDLISYRFYGTEALWWIIALANEMELVPNDLYEGQELVIPSGRRVFSQILRRPSRGVEGR